MHSMIEKRIVHMIKRSRHGAKFGGGAGFGMGHGMGRQWGRWGGHPGMDNFGGIPDEAMQPERPAGHGRHGCIVHEEMRGNRQRGRGWRGGWGNEMPGKFQGWGGRGGHHHGGEQSEPMNPERSNAQPESRPDGQPTDEMRAARREMRLRRILQAVEMGKITVEQGLELLNRRGQGRGRPDGRGQGFGPGHGFGRPEGRGHGFGHGRPDGRGRGWGRGQGW